MHAHPHRSPGSSGALLVARDEVNQDSEDLAMPRNASFPPRLEPERAGTIERKENAHKGIVTKLLEAILLEPCN